MERELEFASGLTDLGYYELAAEKFDRMNWRELEDDDLRVQVVVGAVENYLAAAQMATEPQKAVEYLKAASGETADLADMDLPSRYRGQLHMYRGDIQLELGRARTREYRIAPEDERKPIAGRAADAFGGAIKAFEESADHYADIVEAVEAKANVSDADRRRRNQSIAREVAARTQMAWAHYRRAEFHELAGNEEDFKSDLEEARAIFSDMSDVHSDMLAGVSASLGRGMALAKAGKHEEALESFDKVLQVRPDRAVDIFRFQAAYEKAGTLQAMGRYEDAVETLRGISREFGSLPSMLEVAVRMRFARTLAAAGQSNLEEADELEKEAGQLREKNRTRQAGQALQEARGLRSQARSLYANAVRQARVVAQAGVPESRQAQVLLGRWLEMPGLKGLESPTDLFARGEAALEAGKLEDAARFYNQAIDAARTSEEGAGRVVHNALIQLGKAHIKMGDKLAAGKAFTKVARDFPDSPFAEKSAVYATVLLGQAYQADPSEQNTEAYVAAQEVLVGNFPHNETARKAAFRLGEIARDNGRFLKAADYYLKVGTASEFYEKARYLAGYCFYRASVPPRREGRTQTAEDLFKQAEDQLRDFVAWTRTETSGSAQVRAQRTRWAANALLLLAQMYDDTNQPRKLLEALDDEATETLAKAENGEELASRARLLRLAAHASIGGKHNDLAQQELRSILDDPQIEADLKAEAARVVGQNYVRQARRLERQAEDAPDITEADVRAAFGKAKESLQMSLQLNPEQTADQYAEVARTLYQAGAYEEAARTFQELVDKFEGEEGNTDVVRDARLWIARCYLEADQQDKAIAQYEKLLDASPRWMDLRAELAEVYGREEVGKHGQAARHWKLIEQTRRPASRDWFEARYQRIRNHALDSNKSMAYQLMATTAVSYPNLGGGARARKFMELSREQFSEEQISRIEELTNKGSNDGE